MAVLRVFMAQLFATCLLATAVAAARTFRCNEVWSQPSPNNKIEDCLGNQTHLQALAKQSDEIPHIVYAVLPLLCFIIGFLCCPIVTTCRYCCKCCGSYRRRPETVCCGGSEWDLASPEEKEAAYQHSSVRNTKVCSVMVLFIGIAMLLIAVTGTTSLNNQYVRVFSETKNVLTWVDTQAINIRNVMTINETGTLIPPLTEETFDFFTTKIADINQQLDDAKTTADPYVENINTAALVVGVVPILFLIVTVFAAVCDIRRCLLCCNSLCHYLFLIIYSLLSFIFLVVALVVGNGCGERDLFLASPSNPGLIALVGVPLCEKTAPFNKTKSDINDVIVQQAGAACTAMLSICDASTTYSTSDPDKVFTCATLTNATAQCQTFAQADSMGRTLVLKPGNSRSECRRNVSDASTTFTPCNISTCATNCSDDFVRSTSATIVTNLGYASNGEYAYRAYVQPLLSCNTVYDQALRPLVVCNQFIVSMQLVGGAFFGYAVLFLIGMVVIWRGQKRFFKTTTDHEVESDLEDLDQEEEEFVDIKAVSTDQLVNKEASHEPLA